MKAKILSDSTKYDVPIAFLRGRRLLHAQDFVVARNLLVNDPRFLVSLAGTLIISPPISQTLNVPGIEITGEFKRTRFGDEIPMWYTAALSTPVKATRKTTKSVQQEFVAGPNKIVRVGGVIDKDNQYIVTNTIVLTIDDIAQRTTAFYIDHMNGAIAFDTSDLPAGNHRLTLVITVVEIELQVLDYVGVVDLRVSHYFENEYLVRVLFNNKSTAKVVYTGKETSVTEIVSNTLTYKRVPPEFVAKDTYTYAFEKGNVTLPSSRSFQRFALRTSKPDSRTTIFIDQPLGVSIEEPWFIRLGGNIPDAYAVRGLSKTTGNRVSRREFTKAVSLNQVPIAGRDIYLYRGADGSLQGIKVYPEGYPDMPLPVISFSAETGLVSFDIDIPRETTFVAEYIEIPEWAEYIELQLNPSLELDGQEILNKTFLIYMVPDPIDSVRHYALDRFENGIIKEYTFQELKDFVLTIDPYAIPIALVEIRDPVDQDFYEAFDARARGGYEGDKAKTVDYAAWDGEDVDITGVIVKSVPALMIDELKTRVMLWEGLDDASAQEKARILIDDAMEKYKRIGMKFYDK